MFGAVVLQESSLEYHVSMHVFGLAGWCGHESRRRLMNRRQERKKLRMNEKTRDKKSCKAASYCMANGEPVDDYSTGLFAISRLRVRG